MKSQRPGRGFPMAKDQGFSSLYNILLLFLTNNEYSTLLAKKLSVQLWVQYEDTGDGSRHNEIAYD